MSKSDFTMSSNIVIDMLRRVGGTKGCNLKTVKNLLRSVPSIPKLAKDSGVDYFAPGYTWPKYIDDLSEQAKKTTLDQSILIGMVIDGSIKAIETVNELIEDSHFETDRPGRSEGSTKITIKGKDYTTGEHFEQFAKSKIADLLTTDVPEADKEGIARMIRYTCSRLKEVADILMPPKPRKNGEPANVESVEDGETEDTEDTDSE